MVRRDVRRGDVKRIGEILVENGWIDPPILQRALARHRELGQRLCSFLITHGVLEPDQASRALGEQHGVAAVLQKHLRHRQQSLAGLLPATLARACVALPIGRMGNGHLIVCVRDPSPALRAQLARAMNERIVLAVAPADQLQLLVAETYGPDDDNEFDVDMSTGPVPSLAPTDEDDDVEPLDDLSGMELVELDDHGVSKDHSMSGLFQLPGQARTPTLPPLTQAASQDAISIPRTATPVRVADLVDPLDAPTVRGPVARVARTGLDAAGASVAPRTTSRSGLDAAGAMPSRPPARSGLHAAVASSEPPAAPTPVALEALAAGSVVPTALSHEDEAPAMMSLDLEDDAAAALEPAHVPSPASAAEELYADLELAPITMSPEGPRASDRLPARTRSTELDPLLDPTPFPSRAPSLTSPPTGSAPVPVPPDDEHDEPDEPDAAPPPPVDEPAVARRPSKTWGSAPIIMLADLIVPPRTSASPKAPAPEPTEAESAPRAPATKAVPAARAALERAAAARARVQTPARPIPSILAPRKRELDVTSVATAATPDGANDAALALATAHWRAALLLELDDDSATGVRGFGPDVDDEAVRWTVISRAEPTLVQAAAAGTEVVTTAPADADEEQAKLTAVLGDDARAIALVVGGAPRYVLAVGHPLGDDDVTVLEQLAHALAAAHDRLSTI